MKIARTMSSNEGVSGVAMTNDENAGRSGESARQARDSATGYGAHLYPGTASPLAPALVHAVQLLEQALARPVWLLVQDPHGARPRIDDAVPEFLAEKELLARSGPIALVIDGTGGEPKAAYQLAMFLRRQCGGFVAVVPRKAKSAATLLALGAAEIWLGRCAELGPLDTQVRNADGVLSSALDDVQAIERLQIVSVRAVLATMESLIAAYPNLQRKVDVVMPLAANFVAGLMRPMIDDIDAVTYAQRSRQLRVPQEYAIRLLMAVGESEDLAREIAAALVERYPDHGFAIDIDEAVALNLGVVPHNSEATATLDILDEIAPHLRGLTAVGRLRQQER